MTQARVVTQARPPLAQPFERGPSAPLQPTSRVSVAVLIQPHASPSRADHTGTTYARPAPAFRRSQRTATSDEAHRRTTVNLPGPDDRSGTSYHGPSPGYSPPERLLRRLPHAAPSDRPADTLLVASDDEASGHAPDTDTVLSSAPRCTAGAAPGRHRQMPPASPCPSAACRMPIYARAGVPAISAAPGPSKPS